MPVTTLRLLRDGSHDGPANMARDEALLESVGAGTSPATLRCYAWQPATISLGYFQEFADVQRLDSPARDLAVVRRTTGGGAILHDLELTYSITLPLSHPWLTRGPNALYSVVHNAIIRMVGGGARLAGCGDHPDPSRGESARRGPFFCFARRHALDVIAPRTDSRDTWAKLCGSAQRRTRHSVLQHGSVLLRSRYAQQPCTTWSSLGGSGEFGPACERFVQSLAEGNGTEIVEGGWTRDELSRAVELAPKYSSDAWTRRR